MSHRFIASAREYLAAARRAAPRTIPALCSQMRYTHLRNLPHDCLFEPFRCPVRDAVNLDDVFPIHDEDRFFVDVIGAYGGQDVLCADEVRRRCHGHLTARGGAHVLLWIVTDVHDGSCRCVMEVERSAGGDAYLLNALLPSFCVLTPPSFCRSNVRCCTQNGRPGLRGRSLERHAAARVPPPRPRGLCRLSQRRAARAIDGHPARLPALRGPAPVLCDAPPPRAKENTPPVCPAPITQNGCPGFSPGPHGRQRPAAPAPVRCGDGAEPRAPRHGGPAVRSPLDGPRGGAHGRCQRARLPHTSSYVMIGSHWPRAASGGR
jgi:hypothetical protein